MLIFFTSRRLARAADGELLAHIARKERDTLTVKGRRGRAARPCGAVPHRDAPALKSSRASASSRRSKDVTAPKIESMLDLHVREPATA
jgi:hypothetical protein